MSVKTSKQTIAPHMEAKAPAYLVDALVSLGGLNSASNIEVTEPTAENPTLPPKDTVCDIKNASALTVTQRFC
jgi:hypothetical protein